jgi:hypothetical protein
MKTREAHIHGQERGDWRAAAVARPGIRSHQRGAGKIKAILVTAVLAFAVYAAVKIVPPYAAEYQLADKMQEQARFAVVNHYTDEQIRDNVFKVVQDLEIPVKREVIKVEASQQIVKISVDYTVPIDLIVYHLDLHFTPSSENKALY